jgi:hypothetical protein
LRIPPNGTIHIISDSTLKLYPNSSVPGGLGGNTVTVTHRVRDANYGVRITEHVTSGARIQEMIVHLRSLTNDQVASFDCTILVCMFNAVNNQRQLDYAEASGMSSLVIELCALLNRHKRAAIIMGGSAALWQFSEEWDSMVQKNVALSRVSGIMTINGTRYFEELVD